MPNLLELDSLTRYRLFMAIGSVLLFSTAIARILAEDPGSSVTRFVAAASMGVFALLAGRISWVADNHHALALLCLLPLTLHMGSMTYLNNLSYEMAIANMVILTLICSFVDSRRWLNINVTVWCTCVISVAWIVPEPIISPLTYTVLMIVIAVFIGMLVMSFYEGQELLRRKIAELDESQAFAQVGTWEVDMRTLDVSWSDSTFQIMEMDTATDFLSFERLLPATPENQDFSDQIKDFFNGNHNFDAIGQLTTGSGKNIWVHSRGTTFFEQGKATRKLGVFSDISQHMERERALEEARRKAESAAAARTQFLANMSHEIRTPLNGVIGMASLLEGEQLSHEAKQHVKVIQNCSETLLATINDILDFTKLDAGKVSLEEKPFSLPETIQASADIVRQAISEKGLELQVTGETPDADLLGDPLRLKQVLVNLLANACKFTDKGSIRVHTTFQTTSTQGCRFRLQVIDTGIGISQEAQRSLFSAFVQADASTTRKYGGTGLGLAISKKIIEQMKGQIGVSSELGEGSTFFIDLELPTSAVMSTDSPAPTATELNKKLRVLLAEDNKVNQTVATRMLAKLGLEPIVANNGQEAMREVQANDFDLVLMDLQMPTMDGPEATQLIRELPGIQQPKIIALTANATAEDRARCIEAGMDDFLPKPIRLEDLKSAISANSGI